MPADHIKIEEVTTFSPEIGEALRRLTHHYSENPELPSDEEMKAFLTSRTASVFIARDTQMNAIVGMATLVVYRILSRKKAIIESVAVEPASRRQGIGEALIRATMEKARGLGVAYINLTSADARVEANRMYEKVGFVKRNTNYYKLSL